MLKAIYLKGQVIKTLLHKGHLVCTVRDDALSIGLCKHSFSLELALLVKPTRRCFKMIPDDGLPLRDADIAELPELLLNHLKIFLGISM